MSSLSPRVLSLAIAALFAAQACSSSKPAEKQPLAAQSGGDTSARSSLPPETRAALDSGNSAYRAGQYEKALASYRSAAKSAPDNAAPYFGIYMAAGKLNNKALADSATAAINARSGGQPGLSDSAMKAMHSSTMPAAQPHG
ncbi:MAG TPA: hypothetical protein VHB25_01495 [Gemmatimonadaceae bacterium]|nr:hypothetical protein [Gemmatimonadaceae bacterium]